ncbi:RrF2 family transcriptional regulator [Floricoccus penangensis]|uniref:Rrf2 family transcriptional regulator n=1 Tax=Floricoccus penangensis TaxID=1859475 RepID=A0A9Q5NYT1_9LACT|nr:Rrf2 family transcriptional regulator [Floricoccus penangensis]OFI45750.1 hypothetical protein BG262_07055 [Floricoccus penangensis]URZ88087.1 Rrf2 family transcriptional regulator [Floricoccus penangensis]
MKFTKATNIGLHVMTYMVQNNANKVNLTINELAEKFEVSPSYLSKILTLLAKENLVRSVSGVKGGYKLGANFNDITFFDVIKATEGVADNKECLSGNEENKCPINTTLEAAEIAMWDYLKLQKLSELEGL